MECTTQQTNRMDDKISRIIDKVLNQVFGKEATLLIYRHLKHSYHLKPKDIGRNIELFAQGLEDFLRSGACVVERKILEDIYSSYGLIHKLEIGKADCEDDFVNQMKQFMRRA